VDGHYLYTLPDGSEIEQWESPGEHYIEEVRRGHTNRSTYRLFDYATKRLLKGGEQFFRFPTGIWRTYDRDGRVTEQVDHERAFRVSVADLEQIVRETLKVEINLRGNGVGVMRDELPTPTYTVFFPNVPGDDSAIRFVVFDGTSGKIVEQIVKQRTKD
jgi:hypothetical protein